MKRYLLITYAFAPNNSVATQRQHHFARYLDRFGWAATVVCRKPTRKTPLDPALERELPLTTHVKRTRGAEVTLPQRAAWRLGWNTAGSFLAQAWFPDQTAGWMPFAWLAARDVLAKEKIDAIVSSGPPYSSHLVAARLAQKSGLPWVMDYRDEWFDNAYISFPTPLHRSAVKRVEDRMLSQAESIAVVTTRMAERLGKRTDPGKIHYIPNGYDESLFTGEITSPENERFTLGYIGSFYGLNQPDDLFSALERLVTAGRIDAKRVRFLHVGTGRYSIPQVLAGVVEHIEPVPRAEAIRLMRACNALTLVLPDQASLSTKIFEYLRSGRPIIAVTPPAGVLAELMRETNGGDVVSTGDVAGLANSIANRYDAWSQSREDYQPQLEKIQKYSRENTAKAFAALLDELVKRH